MGLLHIIGKAPALALYRYTRGTITVLDRAGLEEEACACYGIIRAEYQRVLG